jgi:hypothetical protein
MFESNQWNLEVVYTCVSKEREKRFYPVLSIIGNYCEYSATFRSFKWDFQVDFSQAAGLKLSQTGQSNCIKRSLIENPNFPNIANAASPLSSH